jgi:peptidoglycan hydrolase-like protein with peptidoglycan-binding domain
VTVEAFISVADAPVDEYLVPDVGDESPKQLETDELARAHALAAFIPQGKTAPKPVVPFTHPIQLGSVGKDVIGAKRAIWHANGLHVPAGATRSFGPIAVKQLQTFQEKHGLQPDGVLGPETLRKLGPFFDQYAFLLYEGYAPGADPHERMRRAIVAYALWGYNNRAAIGYSEYRPMTLLGDLEHLPVSEDCSTFATKAYKFAGAADPNGYRPGYPGAGNTSTMRAHGIVVPLGSERPGDLPQYRGPDHVSTAVGSGRCVSHGSAIGPLLLPITYRPLYEIRSYL